jgi:hypothetical protein
MAETKASERFGCDKKALDVKKMDLVAEPHWSSYRIEGCDRWAEYRGSCEPEYNECDVTRAHPDCEGMCRVELVDEGPLD